LESIEIIKIKLKGIIDCVDGYVAEPYIENILKEFKKALDENNLNIIIFSCEELVRWYSKNIKDILENEYVYNKDTHRANITLISEITKYLKDNKQEFEKEMILSKKGVGNSINRITNIINVLNKFHLVVKQLRERHESRETLDVSDEYDVQDLLHSLLYIYCDDIRDEEWTPSYAGKCSRQDFLLKNEKIVIETKKTRKGLGAKELTDELIIDIDRYRAHPDCKTLICFVYDPEERIKNPRGIENDLTRENDKLKVIVIIK
jgi:hypothetical protein